MLAELQSNGSIALQLLSSVFNVFEPSSLEPVRERFESTAGRIERSLGASAGTELAASLRRPLERLASLGLSTDNAFELRRRELELATRQRDLLARNRQIAIEVNAVVDDLVRAANARTREATLASSEAVLTARGLLVGISAVSLTGAILIAWLFIDRILLRRLEQLSTWMREMAAGNLEKRVELGGRDEVADMAAAAEVFRRAALEARRLNLIEKLAAQLQAKNAELETALRKLSEAQSQIVMREKLAALGELTAGVAHEIRNPLNFVKNFAEGSEELIEELRELLDGDLTPERRAEVVAVTDDLSENLKRIRSHEERADRIVREMLLMSRERSDADDVDVNGLVEEYAKLAYYAARATEPELNVNLKFELDPAVGSVRGFGQDLGRMMVNLISNACDATAAERAANAHRAGIVVRTKRSEDEIMMTVEDDGEGIPEGMIREKMFTPFFTTKAPGKGTGLGLAMCADIAREHGGRIHAESAPGEWSRLVVTIPAEGIAPNTAQ